MTERSSAVTVEMWLIVKRDLYFRPGCLGYTGIKDEAGRYPYEFAKDYDSGECRIVREIDAPEFTGAAYHDLVIKHLQRQRAGLRAEIERLRAHAQQTRDCGGVTAAWAVLNEDGTPNARAIWPNEPGPAVKKMHEHHGIKVVPVEISALPSPNSPTPREDSHDRSR